MDCCSINYLCGQGQGNCENDNDCQNGLTCENTCPEGFPEGYKCCHNSGKLFLTYNFKCANKSIVMKNASKLAIFYLYKSPKDAYTFGFSYF